MAAPKPIRDETLTDSPGGANTLVRPDAALFVVMECDRPSAGSSRHLLRGVEEVSIGRGDDRVAKRALPQLHLSLPSARVSSKHARVSRTNAGWQLEDLGSRNGTRVNGATVVHHVLQDGDVIELGHSFLLFRAVLHAPPDALEDFDTRSASFAAPGLGTLLPSLAAEIDALMRISRSDVPVLIRGETGTGKERVARAVHTISGRSGPFVAVNSGAIPHALVESQLFGHVRGAFSGALRDEPGFVRASSGGTLLLDEIGDLPAASQAALLRVLQEGEVVPVGSTRPLAVDLRIVAATHQPLEALVARGAFRADLLARVDGFTFALPPLRERREDLGLFVADILRELAPPESFVLSPEVGRALLRYAWPLNIRELRHALARGVALARDGALSPAHLPPALKPRSVSPIVALFFVPIFKR